MLTIAVDGAAGVCQTEGCAAGSCSEEAGSESPDDGTDEMGMEDVESVINLLEQWYVALAEIEGDL